MGGQEEGERERNRDSRQTKAERQRQEVQETERKMGREAETETDRDRETADPTRGNGPQEPTMWDALISSASARVLATAKELGKMFLFS